MAGEKLADARTGKNGRHALVGMLRQAVFSRLATRMSTTPNGCSMIRRCDGLSAARRFSSPLTKSRFQARVGSGDDDDCGEFPVDGGDQAEGQRRVGLENENEGGYGFRGLPRRPLTVEGAHQDAEIEPGDMDQVALVEVLPSA